MVVGVRDNSSGLAALVGSPLDPVRTQRRIYELTEPGLIVTVDNERWSERILTVITVPRSPDIHQVGGRATERVGSSWEPMSSARIAVVLADRRADDWSAEDAGVPISQVTAGGVEEVRAPLELRSASGMQRI